MSDRSLSSQGEAAAFPSHGWGWRHPIRRLSWNLAWWLMCRVAMRGYTTHQQGRTIHDALGFYRPRVMRSIRGTAANTTAVFEFPLEQDPPGSGPFGF